jgi:hypothetical protein
MPSPAGRIETSLGFSTTNFANSSLNIFFFLHKFKNIIFWVTFPGVHFTHAMLAIKKHNARHIRNCAAITNSI